MERVKLFTACCVDYMGPGMKRKIIRKQRIPEMHKKADFVSFETLFWIHVSLKHYKLGQLCIYPNVCRVNVKLYSNQT